MYPAHQGSQGLAGGPRSQAQSPPNMLCSFRGSRGLSEPASLSENHSFSGSLAPHPCWVALCLPLVVKSPHCRGPGGRAWAYLSGHLSLCWTVRPPPRKSHPGASAQKRPWRSAPRNDIKPAWPTDH